MEKTKKKNSKGKWVVLYVLAGLTDLVQILVDLTGIGIVASTAAEPFIGVGLIAYLKFILKVNVFQNFRRIGSILASFGLGAITGGAAPFWIIDVWYIHRDVKRVEAEEAQAEEQAEQFKNVTKPPKYVNGRRQPDEPEQEDEEPRYKNGVGRPIKDTRSPEQGSPSSGRVRSIPKKGDLIVSEEEVTKARNLLQSQNIEFDVIKYIDQGPESFVPGKFIFRLRDTIQRPSAFYFLGSNGVNVRSIQ